MRTSPRKDKSISTSLKGGPLWMSTMADLMTNLLTFFVLMAALSVPEKPGEVIDRINAIRRNFGGNALSSTEATKIFSTYVSMKTVDMDRKSASALKTLNNLISQLELGSRVDTYKRGKDIHIVIPIEKLFSHERWKINKKFFPVLKEIARIIKNGKFQVGIYSYWEKATSPVFMQPSSIFTAQLAGKVLRFFLKERNIPQTRFSITGYGNARLYKQSKASTASRRKLVILMKNPMLEAKSVNSYGIFNLY